MPDIDLTYYRRNLPHRLPTGEGLFITFRLAGSLPAAKLQELAAEWEKIDESRQLDEDSYARQRRYFGRYDKLLDEAGTGPVWLKIPGVANAVKAALHFHDGKAYQLVCYCIMANHVHVVVVLPDGAPLLARTLQSIKSFSAQQINKHLNRSALSATCWKTPSKLVW